MSINLSKWLFNIPCPIWPMIETGFNIPTIWVDSPKLTASYYKEYLGFKVIRNPFIRRRSLLLYRKKSWILVKTTDCFDYQNSINKNRYQKITLHTLKIDLEYSSLVDKVWIVKPMSTLNSNGKNFTIKDCNGIEIVYEC